jgi:acetolactate synthase I/II/III large subunit
MSELQRVPSSKTPDDGSTGPYVSDLVVGLLNELGVEYVAFNPGASFRGLQDSLAQLSNAPILVPCLHEGIAVAVGHGYAKAAGKPMVVLLHNLVGLQNGSMAIYNAWCDRAPLMVIGGTGPMSSPARRPWIDWIHTALVQGQVVRDYVKWDDQPFDAESIPESLIRAYRVATAAPPGPVYVCLDAHIQEEVASFDVEPSVVASYPEQGEPAPSAEVVTWLSARWQRAQMPVILTDYAGATPEGFALLTELAERLHAPVIDLDRRMNIATNHPLNASGTLEVLDKADLVIAIDVEDLWGPLRNRVWFDEPPLLRARDGVLITHFSPAAIKLRSFATDYQRLVPSTRLVTAGARETLLALVDEVARRPPDPDVLALRRAELIDAFGPTRAALRLAASTAEAIGAIPLERMVHELGVAVGSRKYTVVHGSFEAWEKKLWDLTEPGQHLGWHGGGGLGYGLGGSIGAALALSGSRLCIDVQPDGELLFTPQALWTAAHLRVPLLIVTNNNRQYGNTVQHGRVIAESRGRDVERRLVGSSMTDPAVDLAAMARSFGVWATGPITQVSELAAAFAQAISVVESGFPALVDVITPGG